MNNIKTLKDIAIDKFSKIVPVSHVKISSNICFTGHVVNIGVYTRFLWIFPIKVGILNYSVKDKKYNILVRNSYMNKYIEEYPDELPYSL